MESSMKPEIFVTIAQGIRPCEAIIFPNFVKFTASWVPKHQPAVMKVKFGMEELIEY